MNKECENIKEALQKASGLESCSANRLSPNGTEMTATESVISDSGIEGGSTQSESGGSSIWPSPSNFLSQYSMLGTSGLAELQRVLEVIFIGDYMNIFFGKVLIHNRKLKQIFSTSIYTILIIA